MESCPAFSLFPPGNGHPNTATPTMETFWKLKWDILPHPPDLEIMDFHLFAK